LKLNQLGIEQAKQQVISTLAIDLGELEVFVMQALLNAGPGGAFAHPVVFLRRPLHVIQRGVLWPLQAGYQHLRESHIFRPRDSALLVLPEFLDTEMGAHAGYTSVAQYSFQLGSLVPG